MGTECTECIKVRDEKELQRTRSLRCLIRCEELLSDAIPAHGKGKHHVTLDHMERVLSLVNAELARLKGDRNVG